MCLRPGATLNGCKVRSLTGTPNHVIAHPRHTWRRSVNKLGLVSVRKKLDELNTPCNRSPSMRIFSCIISKNRTRASMRTFSYFLLHPRNQHQTCRVGVGAVPRHGRKSHCRYCCCTLLATSHANAQTAVGAKGSTKSTAG